VILLRCISTALAYQDPDMDTHIQIWIWICPSSRWIALWPLIRTIENRNKSKIENPCKFSSNFATNLHIALHSTQQNVSSYVLRFYVRIHPPNTSRFFVRIHPPNTSRFFVRIHPPNTSRFFVRFSSHHVSSYVFHHVSSYVLFANL
jgi:hypothetical protein